MQAHLIWKRRRIKTRRRSKTMPTMTATMKRTWARVL
jgi:hypothetical protein